LLDSECPSGYDCCNEACVADGNETSCCPGADASDDQCPDGYMVCDGCCVIDDGNPCPCANDSECGSDEQCCDSECISDNLPCSCDYDANADSECPDTVAPFCCPGEGICKSDLEDCECDEVGGTDCQPGYECCDGECKDVNSACNDCSQEGICFDGDFCCNDGSCAPNAASCPCTQATQDTDCQAGEECCVGVCQDDTLDCTSCTQDSECPDSEICCEFNGECKASVDLCTCDQDSDCGSGYECCSGMCQTDATACSNCDVNNSGNEDINCPDGEYCCPASNTTSDGLCVADPVQCLCEEDNDCNGTDICCDGSCVASGTSCATCAINEICPDGQYCCGDDSCAASGDQCTCSSDSDCDGSFPYCCDGTCQVSSVCDSCANNDICPDSQFCCSFDDTCVADQIDCECSSNSDCGSGDECCTITGQCIDAGDQCWCVYDSHCGGGTPYCCKTGTRPSSDINWYDYTDDVAEDPGCVSDVFECVTLYGGSFDINDGDYLPDGLTIFDVINLQSCPDSFSYTQLVSSGLCIPTTHNTSCSDDADCSGIGLCCDGFCIADWQGLGCNATNFGTCPDGMGTDSNDFCNILVVGEFNERSGISRECGDPACNGATGESGYTCVTPVGNADNDNTIGAFFNGNEDLCYNSSEASGNYRPAVDGACGTDTSGSPTCHDSDYTCCSGTCYTNASAPC